MLRKCLLVCVIITVLNTVEADLDEHDCPIPIPRRRWGGKYPTQVEYHVIPVKNVMLQHTYTVQCFTTSTCSKLVQDSQGYQQTELNAPDSLFNFYIGDDGNVYETLGWYHQAPNTQDYNTTTIEIAFIGTFNDVLPSERALNATKKLLECGVLNDKLDDNYGVFAASQLTYTDSPGRKLSEEVQKWDHYVANPTKGY